MTERDILKIKYRAFMNEYSSGYNKEALKYIEENFWKCRNSHDIPDILMQVYSELNVLDENIYLKHLDKMKSIFNIDCNVLEIGGGMIPSLGNILAKEQLNIGKGMVTVYDPMLCTKKSNYKNLVLKKEIFSKETNIVNYDLLVGIMPCAATEDIIRKACTNKKDFYIFMCGCTHFTIEQMRRYEISTKSYHNYIINLANSLCKTEINVDNFENKYGLNYPVLYKKF